MMPDVSVVIPTFNRWPMVAEAVASALAQREVSLELIVVDDGSTDDTLARLTHELKTVPTAIHMLRTDNRGPAAARNRGVAMAHAPLVAFLDSDDLWAPEKLGRHLELMLENPGCAISQTDEIWIRNGRRVNPGMRHRKRAGDYFVESLRTCLVSPSAVLMTKELFDSVGGFDEDMRAGEDYDLWLRIQVEHEIGLLDEPLVTRRGGHPDQLSATTPAIDRFRILALVKLLGCDSLGPKRRLATTEVLIEKCRIYASGLSRRGRIDAAQRYEWVARQAGQWVTRAIPEIGCAIRSMREMLR